MGIHRIKNDNNYNSIIQKYLQNLQICTTSNMMSLFNNNIDVIDFLKNINSNSIDFIVFDPPYNTTLLKEYYKNCGIILYKGWY